MKKEKWQNHIKCPYCGYNNKEENALKYGTCTGCRKILDEKTKFKHDMVEKLRLWRKDK